MAWVVLVSSVIVLSSPPAQANFPGSNGKIAFVRTTDAGSFIFTADPDGTHLKKLTEKAGNYSNLDWAPDGSKLAYVVSTETDSGVWVMNADGSGSRRVSAVGVNRGSPSWSPDGRYLAVDGGDGAIYRIDTEAGHEVVLRDSETILEGDNPAIPEDCRTDGTNATPWDLPILYSRPSWAPTGDRIAVVRSENLPPFQVDTYSCDGDIRFRFDIGVMSSFGGEVTKLTDEERDRYDDLPDWSPDGTKVVFSRANGDGTTQNGVSMVSAGGGALTHLAVGFGGRPRFSPDGNKILFTRDKNQDGLLDVWTMDAKDGSKAAPLIQDQASNAQQDWQPAPAGKLDVTLKAFGHNGNLLDGNITIAQTFDVELTIRNKGDAELTDFKFAHDAPLVIDERSTGEMIFAGPDPPVDPDLKLGPDEEITYNYELEATVDGLAAAHTKVTASANGAQLEGHGSLRFDIANGVEVTKELARWAQIESIQTFLQKNFGTWFLEMAKRGQELTDRLSAVLSPAQRLKWFGSATGLSLTPFHHAMATLRGVAPEMVAATLPENGFEGHSMEELNAAYNGALKKELGVGVSEYVEGYAGLAGSVKKGLTDSWSEVMLASYNMFGTATPEEQQQYAAYMLAVANGTDKSVDNLVNTVGREVPKWLENGTYLKDALDMAIDDAFLLSPDLQAQMAKETEWRENMFKNAQKDPVKFQQDMAKRDAEIINLVLPLILDTLVGGGVTRLGGKLKGVVVGGKGAAVIRSGEAVGVIEDTGKTVAGPKTKIPPAEAGVAATDIAEAERAGNYLDEVDGATIVQSSDAGAVYELPNVGGVPEVTLDAKATILGELEDGWHGHSGEKIQLAEILKPSSAYRKVGGVAKTELTPNKTGKAAMLDAGAPKEVLAEASVWKGPDPSLNPDFKNLSKPRQQAAMAEWKKANKAWDEFHNPKDPTSKEARLAQCIGNKERVPLDLEPNQAGMQRFVTAHYEVEEIVSGDARAKLIRVKYYEIENVLVDQKTGAQKVVNRKTVVDLPEAAPQTPDADAVAVGKVVGTDAAGRPIIEPLSRAEREYIMPRYTDKNIKARRKPPGSKGAINDLAEHGATLVMDDASSTAAGPLLARYGAIFVKEHPGLDFLARISKSIAGKGGGGSVSKLYHELVDIVRSEGGFGQHAVVVTRDTRYLGEVNIANW